MLFRIEKINDEYHPEWYCDVQIRTIECRKCGKRAWIKDYRDLFYS
jgi:hypothetical protein